MPLWIHGHMTDVVPLPAPLWLGGMILVPAVEGAGVSIARGTGRIVGVKRVVVEAGDEAVVELVARLAVVIGTGSEMVVPEIPGLDDVSFWGPREAMSSSEAPTHLTVIGAGAVGCKLATAYSNFRIEVMLVSSTAEILRRVDPEAGKIVRKNLVGKGVTVHLSSKPVRIEKDVDGLARVHLTNGTVIAGTQVLIAAGRKPLSSDFGLKTVGLPDNGGFIAVNDDLSVKGLAEGWFYAGDDVNGRAPLTHMSKYHGRIISNAIIARAQGKSNDLSNWGPAFATADIEAVPQVTFTDPAVASVGLTRTAAVRLGRKFKEVVAVIASAGAILHVTDYGESWAQWIVDEDTNVLLGATFVGQNVAKLLHASTAAIAGGMNH